MAKALSTAASAKCVSRVTSKERHGRTTGVLSRGAPARRYHQDAHRGVQTRLAAASTDMDRMKSAEARWENQIREGRVKNVSGQDTAELMKDGWVLLDVRPPEEAQKVGIVGAVEIPLFVADPSYDPSALVKKASAFGMGGWWLGGTHMIINTNFMSEVQSKIPKDAKVVVGCQKGLRSLAACEQLSRAGYNTLAWVSGGFDSCRKGELPTVNDKDIRIAGIGGLSELIGWTEVQQDQAGRHSNLGGAEGILKAVAFILVLDLLVFAYEKFAYEQTLGQ